MSTRPIWFPRELLNCNFNTPNFDNQEVYILGDFNVNLKYAGRRIPNGVNKYREFCALHELTQLIKSPTRITKNTSTILDHILTNSLDKIFQVGTLDIGLYIKYRSLKTTPLQY